jgi:PAS domain S-box-containing protein
MTISTINDTVNDYESSSFHVFWIEDNDESFSASKRALDESDLNCKIKRVQHADNVPEQLQTSRIDIVLVDLTDSSELETIQHIVEQNSRAPIIVVVQPGNEKDVVAAFGLGAHDYLIKDSTDGYLTLLPSVLQKTYHQWQQQVYEKTNLKVQESKEQYRQIIEEATDAILVTDAVGYATFVNQACQKMSGYSENELVGMHFTRLVPVEWQERVLSFYQKQFLERESEASLVFPMTTKDGEERWVKQTATLLMDGDSITGFQAIVHDITERKRSEERLQTNLRQLTILREMDLELAQSFGEDYVLSMAIDTAMRLSTADAGLIGLVENNQTQVKRVIGLFPQKMVSTYLSQDTGIIGRVLRHQQAELVSDVTTDTDYVAFIPETYAQMTFPLISSNNLLGVLSLETKRIDRFTSEVFHFLQLLTAHIAVAIDNVQMYENVRQRVAELETLRKTSLSLSSQLNLENVLDIILESTLKLFDDFDNVHLFLYQDERLIPHAALWNDGRKGKPTFEPRPDGVHDLTVRQGETIAIEDMSTHPLGSRPGALISIPLKSEQQVVGVMSIYYAKSRPFPKTELRLLQFLGHQATIAIVNARLVKTLRQSEDKFSRVFRTSPDSITIGSLIDGRYIDVNDSFLQIAEYSRDEVINHTPDELRLWVNPEDRTRFRHLLEEQADVRNFEATIRNKSGEVAIILLSGEALEIDNKQCLLTVAKDVTERKRMEEALRQRNLVLETLSALAREVTSTLQLEAILSTVTRVVAQAIDATSVYACDWNIEQKTTTVLAEYIGSETADLEQRSDLGTTYKLDEHFGDSAEWLKAPRGYSISQVDDPELDPKERAHMEQYGGKSTLVIPLRIEDKNWGYIEVWESHRKRDFTSGEIEIVQAIAHQVSMSINNAQLHEMIQEREELYRDLFENVHDMIQSVGPDGRFLYVNQCWLDTLGYTQAEAQGLHFEDILQPDQRPHCREIFGQSMLGQEFKSTEITFTTKTGQEIVVEGNLSPRIEDGRFVATRGILRDISERKQAEMALHESEIRYRQMFMKNRAVKLLINPKTGAIIEANPAAVEFYGYPADILTTMRIMDINTLSEAEVRDEMQRAKTEQRRLFHFRHKLVSGEIRDVEVHSGPISVQGEQVLFSIVFDVTERKQAEEALQESEERFRSLFDNIPVMMHAINSNGEIIAVSDYWLEKLGYARDEVLGRKSVEFVTETSRRYATPRMQREDPAKNTEYEFVKKNGEVIYVLLSSFTKLTTEGEIDHSQAVLVDITERKQAEEQLRKLSQAIEQSPSPVFITDADGNIEYVNPRFTSITGYTAEEAIGKTPRILKSGQTPMEVYQRMWAAITSGNVWQEEFLNKKKNGDLYWENTLVAPVKNESGEITHFVTIKDDITERRQAEEALLESEEKLRSTLESVDDLVFVLDKDGVYIDYHQPIATGAGTRLLVPPDAFVGRHYRDVMPPDVSALVDNAIDAIIDTQVAHQVEYPLTTEDGEMWFSAKLSMRRDHQGGFGGVTCVVRNVTARKRAEEGLMRAKQAADNANKAKSLFLANMNHELRTPLNAILGFSQIMANEATLSQQHQKNVETILRSGEHLLSLINDVLDISKVEAGKVVLNATDFDLRLLLHDLFDMMKMKAKDKGIQFELEGVSQIPRHVRGDSGKLRQVILNLLSNALKFTDEGHVKLRVYYKADSVPFVVPDTSATGRLFVEVQDTGTGIAPEEINSIFEAFVQSRSGRQLQEGTGLGLAISREFVRIMGGDIGTESTLGEGTRFMFDVRVKEVEPMVRTRGTQSKERRAMRLAPGQPTFRILIAEDQPENQEMLTIIMETLGFEVKTANNGQEAIEIDSSWKPHLIWMDIDMPIMGGLIATNHIRETGRDVIIIVVSASTLEHEQEMIIDAGCDDFVSKPFRTQELIDMLKTYLKVAFIYDNDVVGEAMTVSPTRPVEGSILTSLPPELIEKLKSAAIDLDTKTVQTIAELVRHHDADLSQILIEWMKKFRFDKILALIEEWEQSD